MVDHVPHCPLVTRCGRGVLVGSDGVDDRAGGGRGPGEVREDVHGPRWGDGPPTFSAPVPAGTSRRVGVHWSPPRIGASMAELFIAGEWVSALNGDTREIRCPADGNLVATVDEA